MGSQNLTPGAFPALGSQQRVSTSSSPGRNKVQLKPGHSLMDWIRLGKSGKDLTGLGGKHMDVSPEELKKHNTDKDCWIALRGKVYNVTEYLEFHPGGIDELMKGAGKDATSLFDEIHKWVNAESMLEKCLIGKLRVENAMLRNALLRKGSKSSLGPLPNGEMAPPLLVPAAASTQTPRFDWFQSNKTVSVIVYTKCTDVSEQSVIVEKIDRSLLITIHIKQSVFYVHLELEHEVGDLYQVSVSGDSGKVEIILEKCQPEVQWANIGKHLEKHALFIPNKNYNPAFRDCAIEKIESVTRDTNLYTLRLPGGTRMQVPLGYHVHLRHKIDGMEIVRSYTAVLPSLQDSQTDVTEQGSVIYLMIKIYKDGVFTPWLGSLKPGDTVSVSSYEGSFDESHLATCTHLVMFAAGTGFTPMVRLTHQAAVLNTDKNVKLVFFNKTEADIPWNDQLKQLAQTNKRFSCMNCLSEADASWTGLQGRVTKQMVKDNIPALGQANKLLICVCGPTPFTKSVIQYTDELGYKDMTHAFLG